MSQLDISISFSHLISLLFVFYLFIYYVTYLLIYYWYNLKFRFLKDKALDVNMENFDNSVLLKKILKL
uniref:ATP synthase F0 subunit 8 n=1 Tax=Eudendrium capillare TaxID=308571 RepID=A0A0S2IAZ6_9CNID|nr:ATP synthase F0 subunit 8 [Eudendrium capillare]